MKTKITLERLDSVTDEYRVISLVNRFEPCVGSVVRAADVEAMLRGDEELSVLVRKAR